MEMSVERKRKKQKWGVELIGIVVCIVLLVIPVMCYFVSDTEYIGRSNGWFQCRMCDSIVFEDMRYCDQCGEELVSVVFENVVVDKSKMK